MAYQEIADAEVQPGVIVSSSLMTRLRDNTQFLYDNSFIMLAGDVVLGEAAGVDPIVLISATSLYSGEYRFVIATSTTFDLLRNSVIIQSGAAGSYDISGWAIGDSLQITSAGTLSVSVRGDRAGVINLSVQEGIL